MAGFLAGASGVLYAYNLGAVTATEFDAITAVSMFAVAYLGGITTVTGAILAGTGIRGNWVHLLNSLIGVPTSYQPLLAGVGVLGNGARQSRRHRRVHAPQVGGLAWRAAPGGEREAP